MCSRDIKKMQEQLRQLQTEHAKLKRRVDVLTAKLVDVMGDNVFVRMVSDCIHPKPNGSLNSSQRMKSANIIRTEL